MWTKMIYYKIVVLKALLKLVTQTSQQLHQTVEIDDVQKCIVSILIFLNLIYELTSPNDIYISRR